MNSNFRHPTETVFLLALRFITNWPKLDAMRQTLRKTTLLRRAIWPLLPLGFCILLPGCQAVPAGSAKVYEAAPAIPSAGGPASTEKNSLTASARSIDEFYGDWRHVENLYAKAIAGTIDDERIFKYEVVPALTDHPIGAILSRPDNRSSLSNECSRFRQDLISDKAWREPPTLNAPDKTISFNASIPDKYRQPLDLLKLQFELKEQSALIVNISDIVSRDISKQGFRRLMLGRRACTDAIRRQALAAGLDGAYVVVGKVFARRSISGTLRPQQAVSVGLLDDALQFKYDGGSGHFEISDKESLPQFLIYTKVDIAQLPSVHGRSVSRHSKTRRKHA